MLFAVTHLTIELAPFVQKTAIYRSLPLKVVTLLLQTFLAVLFYQVRVPPHSVPPRIHSTLSSSSRPPLAYQSPLTYLRAHRVRMEPSTRSPPQLATVSQSQRANRWKSQRRTEAVEAAARNTPAPSARLSVLPHPSGLGQDGLPSAVLLLAGLPICFSLRTEGIRTHIPSMSSLMFLYLFCSTKRAPRLHDAACRSAPPFLPTSPHTLAPSPPTARLLFFLLMIVPTPTQSLVFFPSLGLFRYYLFFASSAAAGELRAYIVFIFLLFL